MRVGIVGDIHLPFTHPLYLRFCLDVFDAWAVDRIHFAGDIVDQHALGFWDLDPNGHSANMEADLAAEMLKDWVAYFPEASVSIGNHDERHFRKARKAGIPDRYIKDYAEVWESPGWDWCMQHWIDGVLYEHGTGSSSKDAAIKRAREKRTSLVMGHVHTAGFVSYTASELDRIFGLAVGCGIDCDSYAFAYGKPFPVRPVLGCGIVLDGVHAFFEPMPIGPSEQYNRQRAEGTV